MELPKDLPQLISGKPRIFNSHAHCFTLKHVPDYFAGGHKLMPINQIKRSQCRPCILRRNLSTAMDNTFYFLTNSINQAAS